MHSCAPNFGSSSHARLDFPLRSPLIFRQFQLKHRLEHMRPTCDLVRDRGSETGSSASVPSVSFLRVFQCVCVCKSAVMFAVYQCGLCNLFPLQPHRCCFWTASSHITVTNQYRKSTRRYVQLILCCASIHPYI